MALKGSTTEEKIWNYLVGNGLSEYGAAGLMGNLYAESGLSPTNLQNSYEKKLGYTDDTYTTSVDNGDYQNFVRDSAGYGLAQWTFWSRKQNLLTFVRARNKSIGDLETQLAFLIEEMKQSYSSVYQKLRTAGDVLGASNAVLLQFERPADQSVAVQKKRAAYGQKYYEMMCKGGKGMSNSSLVTCIVKSPNHSGARTHAIDRITPHCVVGQLSASSIGGCFTSPDVKASCNYGIGTEGGICLVVDECNRSWCSSSGANDQRAVTIECASDKAEPYAFNSTVYNKLIELCADICRRNGKNKLVWISDKNKALAYNPAGNEMLLTVHRWFANKSCPGNWMYGRMGELAQKVNEKLGSAGGNTGGSSGSKNDLPAAPFTVKVLIGDLNYRSEPSMSGAVKGQTGKGVFTISEVKDGWGKLKSSAGWIYLENPEYCTVLGKIASTPAQTSSSYMVRITTSVLNVRKGPGTNYGITTKVKKGEVYTIVAEEKNGNTTWGKLKSGAGYISLGYTERV